MKAVLAKCPIGIFAFDENGALVYRKDFPKDAQKALDLFSSKTPKEAMDALKKYDVRTNSSEAHAMLRARMRDYAREAGFSDKEFNSFLSDFGAAFSRFGMKTAVGRDRLVAQAVNALEDVNKSLNLCTTRIQEWYGLHYPELKMSDNELVKTIAERGAREAFPHFKTSTGVDLEPEDEAMLKSYALFILRATEEKKALEKYVRDAMRDIAPNFSSLVDPVLAARLLAMAGTLERLARMTAPTIQLLGAEKALFRHLKERGKPPKFGILFHSSYVQSAPDDKKGKVARILAAKLMLAARMDYYSKKDESEKLKKDMENDLRRALQ